MTIWTEAEDAETFVYCASIGVSNYSELNGYTETAYGLSKGLVYFITIGDAYATHVKIGFTTGNPAKRVASLQTGCPFKMTLLGFVYGCRLMEAELHDVLAADRCEGEWFVYSDYVQSVVRSTLTAEHLICL